MDVLRWKRISGAALSLALIYVVGVALLYAPIRLWLTPHAPGLSELPTLSLELGIYAAIAFLLLAMARRVGFILLWLLLLAAWIANVGSSTVRPEALPGFFILWTVLALPLYVITAWGIPSSSQAAPTRRLSAIEVGALLWAILVIAAFVHIFNQGLDRLAGATAFIWIL